MGIIEGSNSAFRGPTISFDERRPALHDKTRIATSASWGYLRMLQNWVHWVRRLGFQEFTVIAEDLETVRYLRDDPLYSEVVDGPSLVSSRNGCDVPVSNSSMYFDTLGFNKLMNRRASYLQYLLRRWEYVLFSDADVVWLRNPFNLLMGDSDVEVSIDKLEHKHFDIYFCPGFMLLRNTSATRQMLVEWNAQLLKQPQLNQPAFNDAVRREGMSVRALDMRLFQSGMFFFMGGSTQTCLGQAVTAHMNWVVGVQEKERRLTAAKLWMQADVPCFAPEVSVVADDGTTRCMVPVIDCVPNLIVEGRSFPIVFDAYVGLDGVVLDRNRRLYGNIQTKALIDGIRVGPRALFATTLGLPRYTDTVIDSDDQLLRWLAEWCEQSLSFRGTTAYFELMGPDTRFSSSTFAVRACAPNSEILPRLFYGMTEYFWMRAEMALLTKQYDIGIKQLGTLVGFK